MQRTEKTALFDSMRKLDKKSLVKIYKTLQGSCKTLAKNAELMQSIFKNIKIHEYTGLNVKVIESASTFKDLGGIILAETRNTFKILTINKDKLPEIKAVPKKGNVFGFFLNRKSCLAKGEEINYSPTERLKKL